jgi:glutamate racemase
MATRGTVGSDKFARLLASVQGEAEFVVKACNGLALAIEHSTLPERVNAAQEDIARLLHTYTQAMGRFGTQTGDIDTLVLGCTHYVFVESALQDLLGPQVQLVSTGEPVARQTRRLLEAAALLQANGVSTAPRTRLLTTGDLASLQAAAQRWLSLPPQVCQGVSAVLQD